jgi:hypothetical protein
MLNTMHLLVGVCIISVAVMLASSAVYVVAELVVYIGGLL